MGRQVVARSAITDRRRDDARPVLPAEQHRMARHATEGRPDDRGAGHARRAGGPADPVDHRGPDAGQIDQHDHRGVHRFAPDEGLQADPETGPHPRGVLGISHRNDIGR